MRHHLFLLLVPLLILLVAGCALEIREIAPGHYVIAPVAPTGAPRATVTITPAPTATASATNAPSPTGTPGDITPTPTQEGPPATPGPTSTATVAPKPALCEGIVVNPQGLNVRSGASTSAASIGNLSTDAVAIVDRFYIVRDGLEEWAHITSPVAGWVAAIYYDGRRLLWWPEDLSDGERAVWCLPPYVTVEWASNPPPSTPLPVLVGPHTLVGVQGGIVDYPWTTMKCLNHTEALCLEVKRRNPAVTIVYRTLHVSDGMRDCPDYNEWLSPDTWYRKMKPHWPSGFDYYEVINECQAPTTQTMVNFSIRIAELAAQDGHAIVAFSYYPGAPEIAEWDVLYGYLSWADRHPLPDGRYHGIALHAAGYAPADQVPPGSWINDLWVAGRHTLIDARLNLIHGYSLKQFKGPIYVTELGWDDGYQGLSTPPLGWSCVQYARAVAETRRVLAAQGVVDGFHIWNFGSGGTTRWIDLYPCVTQIALA